MGRHGLSEAALLHEGDSAFRQRFGENLFDAGDELLVAFAFADQGEGVVQDFEGLIMESSPVQADADVAKSRSLVPAIAEPLEYRGGLSERGLRLLETAGPQEEPAPVVEVVAGKVRRFKSVLRIVLRVPSLAALAFCRSSAAASASSRWPSFRAIASADSSAEMASS